MKIGSACFAAAAPFFVWFLATIASRARAAGTPALCLAAIAYGCADVTTLAVGAFRPENMAAAPELATVLRDFELLAMGVAAVPMIGMFTAIAVLVLRHKVVWPDWIGWLAATAALQLRTSHLQRARALVPPRIPPPREPRRGT